MTDEALVFLDHRIELEQRFKHGAEKILKESKTALNSEAARQRLMESEKNLAFLRSERARIVLDRQQKERMHECSHSVEHVAAGSASRDDLQKSSSSESVFVPLYPIGRMPVCVPV